MKLRAWLVATALLLVACGPGPEEPEPECSLDRPCSHGLVCDEGLCVPCARDRECGRTEMCHPLQRRCVLRACFGEECGVHDDCNLGLFCVQGLCLSASQSHPDGCAVVGCADGPCNQGQRCHPENFVCEEDLGCENDGHCEEGFRCNVTSGRCERACTEENAVEVCGLRRVCADGRCADCTEDSHCGAGLVCDRQTRTCRGINTCESNRDCERPLVCNGRTRECTVDPGPCRSADNCAPDETCQISTGRCVPRACPADRFEPNDTLGTAAPLSVGGLVPQLTLCEDDVDHYEVGLQRGDRLRVVVETDLLVTFEVDLLGPSGETLARGDLVVEAVASVEGPHYIRCRSRDPHVPYALRLIASRGVPCDADAEEPNDDWLHATPIEQGDLFHRSICPGDEDWYVLTVPWGRTVVAELTHTPSQGPLEILLYDGDGQRLLDSSAELEETQRVQSNALSREKAFIRVKGGSSSVQNRYDLHVRLEGP